MKNILTTKIIFLIIPFWLSIPGKLPANDVKLSPKLLELSGTVEMGVTSDEALYQHIKNTLVNALRTRDDFMDLKMNYNHRNFQCRMENIVSLKKGLKKYQYVFSYNIHFTLRSDGLDYRVNDFRFCPVGSVQNDQNCTKLISGIYSGRNKSKIEKQMKAVAITRAELAIGQLIDKIGHAA